MKELYFLLAILDGESYVWARHMTLGECVSRKTFETNAAVDVAEKSMPLLRAEFECKREK